MARPPRSAPPRAQPHKSGTLLCRLLCADFQTSNRVCFLFLKEIVFILPGRICWRGLFKHFAQFFLLVFGYAFFTIIARLPSFGCRLFIACGVFFPFFQSFLFACCFYLFLTCIKGVTLNGLYGFGYFHRIRRATVDRLPFYFPLTLSFVTTRPDTVSVPHLLTPRTLNTASSNAAAQACCALIKFTSRLVNVSRGMAIWSHYSRVRLSVRLDNDGRAAAHWPRPCPLPVSTRAIESSDSPLLPGLAFLPSRSE